MTSRSCSRRRNLGFGVIKGAERWLELRAALISGFFLGKSICKGFHYNREKGNNNPQILTPPISVRTDFLRLT